MRRFWLTCAFCKYRENGKGDGARCGVRYAQHLRNCDGFRPLQEKAKALCEERGVLFRPERLIDEEVERCMSGARRIEPRRVSA